MNRKAIILLASVLLVGSLVAIRVLWPPSRSHDRDTTTTVAEAGRPSVPSTSSPPQTTPPSTTMDSVPPGDCVLSGALDGYTVPEGTTCHVDGVVTSTANVVVEGTLVMRPGDTLRFVDVDESKFVGGGDDPLPTDVGLWVMGAGVLDAQGTEVTPWAYEWADDWSAADDIVAAPNTEGDFTSFAGVEGPDDVPGVNEYGYAAELMNLTRDVRIEGTPEGYSHVFIRSTAQSTLRFVELRYLGVKVDDRDQTGRYALHLHFNEDATRGMVVEGVVARDIGNHAFVPHRSHGVTFLETIAYDVVQEAYWWDPEPADRAKSDADVNFTNDVAYICTIAAKVDTDGDGRSGGYFLGSTGENPVIRDSVAVGVYSSGGNRFDISGYEWPGQGRTNWTFENNIAHNNEGHGIFVWQNTSVQHKVTDFTAYFNREFGITHGAYRNPYAYSDLELWGNGEGAIELHANARTTADGATQTWVGVRGDGVWQVARHGQPPLAPVVVSDVILPGFVVAEGPGDGSWFEFSDSHFDTVDLTNANPATVVDGLS